MYSPPLILISEVESNLPENIKDRAVSVLKSAVSQNYPIISAVEKVQNEALCEIETVFKGQRFKVRSCYNLGEFRQSLSRSRLRPKTRILVKL